MAIHDCLLLADLDDIIRLLILAAFILGPLLGKLAQPKAQAPAPPRRARVRPGQAGAPAAPNPIEVELERLLRQAAAEESRRDQPTKPQSERTSRPRAPKASTPGSGSPRMGKDAKQPTRGLSSQIASHVEQHLGSHPVSEHATQLGKTISLADERVEQQLQSKFKHGLGQLTDEESAGIAEGTDSQAWATGSADAVAKQARAQLATLRLMLRDPDSLRNAFVLGEILRAPSFDE